MAEVSARDVRLATPRPGVGKRIAHGVWAHRWFALAVIVAACLAGWQGARVIFGPSVVADRVTRGVIVETVVATGNVLTPYRANIGSQITGTVTEVLVEEGQQVVKGQPLIALDERSLRRPKCKPKAPSPKPKRACASCTTSPYRPRMKRWRKCRRMSWMRKRHSIERTRC